MAPKQVVVYNKPGCASCRAVEQYLVSRGIRYAYNDITGLAQKSPPAPAVSLSP